MEEVVEIKALPNRCDGHGHIPLLAWAKSGLLTSA